jgi:microcystin-dependent protein
MTQVEAFISEIRIFPFNYAPAGWAPCDGRMVDNIQHSALFSVIGFTYGNDSSNPANFALPDLRGVAVMMQGTGPGMPTYTVGQRVGTDWVTLTPEQTAHGHALVNKSAVNRGDKTNGPSGSSMIGSVTAITTVGPPATYAGPPSVITNGTPNTSLHPSSIEVVGNTQPHWNAQPFLALSYCICLDGIYPSPD